MNELIHGQLRLLELDRALTMLKNKVRMLAVDFIFLVCWFDLLGVTNDKHAFSYRGYVHTHIYIVIGRKLTMPPYGNEGGSTRRSYTPNWYGITSFSAAARNLVKELSKLIVL